MGRGTTKPAHPGVAVVMHAIFLSLAGDKMKEDCGATLEFSLSAFGLNIPTAIPPLPLFRARGPSFPMTDQFAVLAAKAQLLQKIEILSSFMSQMPEVPHQVLINSKTYIELFQLQPYATIAQKVWIRTGSVSAELLLKRIFNKDCRPYAQVLQSRTGDIQELISTIEDVFTFILASERTDRIDSNRAVATRLLQQTVECGFYIMHRVEAQAKGVYQSFGRYYTCLQCSRKRGTEIRR